MLCDREDVILKITEFGEEYFGGGGVCLWVAWYLEHSDPWDFSECANKEPPDSGCLLRATQPLRLPIKRLGYCFRNSAEI